MTNLEKILKNKLILIIRGYYDKELLKIVNACYNGGVRTCEITFNAEGNPSDKEIAKNIKMLVGNFGDKMVIGAGTVLTKEQIAIAKEAGAMFIVSPDGNEEIIRETKRLGLISVPGAFTPTEMVKAHNCGADLIKVFPADVAGGPTYFKALKGPLSHINLLAVGGVTLDTIEDFHKAGAKGYGISSGILKKSLIDAKDYTGLSLNAKLFVDKISSLK